MFLYLNLSVLIGRSHLLWLPLWGDKMSKLAGTTFTPRQKFWYCLTHETNNTNGLGHIKCNLKQFYMSTDKRNNPMQWILALITSVVTRMIWKMQQVNGSSIFNISKHCICRYSGEIIIALLEMQILLFVNTKRNRLHIARYRMNLKNTSKCFEFEQCDQRLTDNFHSVDFILIPKN